MCVCVCVPVACEFPAMLTSFIGVLRLPPASEVAL